MFNIEKIERLAALKLQGEEKESITKDLEEILNYFNILKEVNTEDVEPLVYTEEIKLFLRKDEIKEGLPIKEVEKNRELFGDNFFKVKKIVRE
ncbi:MAG: Asp-tRNA(Asn)/Glu-tRNA(Gln) amidotransferase subunit GatC [Caldiserica bacterium]|nr:Asp-tRNA(Asn)/Glu-tRNA(Gln) amidotransferase subunit GatC [Caldisericota bacterium]